MLARRSLFTFYKDNVVKYEKGDLVILSFPNITGK